MQELWLDKIEHQSLLYKFKELIGSVVLIQLLSAEIFMGTLEDVDFGVNCILKRPKNIPITSINDPDLMKSYQDFTRSTVDNATTPTMFIKNNTIISIMPVS